MSALLITTALVVAVVSVPTVAGLTAWGLAGGDGEPRNALLGILAAVVGFGSIYNAITCFRAYFFDLPPWQWWLMLLPPLAGVLGLALGDEDASDARLRERLVGLSLQLVLAVPAVLLLGSDAVTL